MTDTSRAADAYRLFLDYGQNFMTPDVIEYGWVTPTVAYELSSGSGIVGDKIYGVTFIDAERSRKYMDESTAVLSPDAGRELIEIMKEEWA